MSESPDNAGVRIFPPALFIGGLVIGYVLDLIRHVPIAPPEWSLAVRILGGVAALAGIALGIAALGLFRRAGTPPEPWETTTRLVFDGPYRFTRNPMYLGMAALLVGLGLVGNSLWPVIAVVPAILLLRTQVIAREEAYLQRKFGAEYLAYKSRVRRWL
ncbi:MAG TPA: isoprenylcysteine carboxylmethyltransferase family protein [Bauldia sp.]|nr:isoprenylcysteine carboxylmethyltransferase family protein [Bauldia sp.]